MKTLKILAILSFVALIGMGFMLIRLEARVGHQCKFDGLTVDLPAELREVSNDVARPDTLYAYRTGKFSVTIEMRNYKK